ncbi:twin-arginine translocase TatA/TatE family subunit [Methylobacterium brachythecii]|uniref:Sec-independent protein translocase protein TatA n=1 Tax=Methylobacterium brachythecii TaxID=1176177 RepID=A0A7W6APD8_9HYPH|nr:twin-arginine translocase TatA/TatE family subunit [Methylobacterium brachythecii]MBB3903422.1 sec-independent protein translocase protein TatA [Methylobacterium brachythecii]GLS45503.1 Sec-independent protein translocase protein TatA [Methylobacterium brachythecii]
MGSLSIWHWVVVAVIVMMLFGRGKVSELMGDVAKGIKAFKKGMAEEDEAPKPQQPPVATMPSEPVRTIPHQGEPSHAPAQSADHRVG